MTTFNHTALADGQQADQTTLNAPLASLDAAIGALATLGTTPKTSVVTALGTAAPTTTAQTVVGAINELDADVGNLTTLGTTPKTSVVAALGTAAPTTTAQTVIGAINELDALIGTAASASGSIGTSVDTDGTLKAGAVDVAAVLASNVVTEAKILNGAVTADKIGASAVTAGKIADNNVTTAKLLDANVTAAKLAATAVPSGNLCFDCYNRYYAPAATSQDGRVRWWSDGAYPTQVSPDTDNPFGCPTIRFASAHAGRRVWLDEMGLMADVAGVRTGHIISAAILCLIPTGRTVQLTATLRDVAGNYVIGSSGSTITGAGTVQIVSVLNRALTETTVSVDLFLTLAGGAGDVDVYAWYVGRGATLQNQFFTEGVQDGQRAQAAVQAALGGYASLGARLDAVDAQIAWPTASVSYGGHLLRDYQAQLSKIIGADGTSQAVIAFIGDSWTDGDYRLTKPTRTVLQTLYGDGGIGWVSASSHVNYNLPAGATRVVAGTWTNRVITDTPSGRGLDLFESNSLDTTAPVGSIAWTAACRAATIYYLKQANGGTFRWQVDTDGWTAVDTANATDALGTVVISGLSDASHTITVEVTVAGTAGVTLFGVDMRKTGNAVRVHKLGHGGARSGHWATLQDATIWTAQLTAIAPHLIVICLGTNDDVADVAPATYNTNLDTLIDRIQTALPAASILLLSPADNGYAAGTYTMSDYVAECRVVAVDQGCAAFDAYALLGAYAAADTRGMYDNSTHISEEGGRVIMYQVCRQLLEL